MQAVAFFDPRLVRQVSLRMRGEVLRFQAYPFPDAKLMVIADSLGDGRTGKAILHSRELKERTKGSTEHMEIPNSFRLQSLLEHIDKGGVSEEQVLKLRIHELRTAYQYLMRCGQLKRDVANEVFGALLEIERDLAEPKRNEHKLAASRNVGKGIGYRSPKAGNPVGPVVAITAKASICRLERRIAQILGIRRFANLRLALVTVFNKESELLFKTLKEEKSLRSKAFQKLIAQLEYMRLQPFEAPARRIEAMYASFLSGEMAESDAYVAIRRELHAVLLVCVVERKVIRLLSYMTHRDLDEAKMTFYREGAIDALVRIVNHIDACDAFSVDARMIAVTKLGHARNILAQEDLFETPKKRLNSAGRILKELTAILPV